MGRLTEIVFEAERPAALARFWAGLLDSYAVRAYDAAEIERLRRLGLTPETDPTVMVDGPGPSLCFQRVPGRRPRPNRLHLDLAVADREAELGRLVGLGARLLRRAEGYLVVADPEGNQFCLTGATAAASSAPAAAAGRR